MSKNCPTCGKKLNGSYERKRKGDLKTKPTLIQENAHPNWSTQAITYVFSGATTHAQKKAENAALAEEACACGDMRLAEFRRAFGGKPKWEDVRTDGLRIV